MLLSMYLSYYASRAWMKTYYLDYVLGMIGLILVTSLSSTAISTYYLFYFFYPFASLSFPFSSIVHVDVYREMGDYTYAYTHDIQFLSLRILSVSNESIRLLFVFSFYLLVNFLGVILGYWFEKRLAEEPFKAELFEFFSFSGFCSFGVCYFISLILPWIAVALSLYSLPIMYIIFFCIYFFWIPALIATTIYGLKRRKE